MQISRSYEYSLRSFHYKSFETCLRISRAAALDVEISVIAKLAEISMHEVLAISSFFNKWTRVSSLRSDYMSDLSKKVDMLSQKG